MKVAVWHNNRGPAMVFSIPPGKRRVRPQAASIKGGPWPKPWRDLEAKGHKVTWEQWVQILTRQHPYNGYWTAEDVPDDVPGIQGALDAVVERARASGGASSGGAVSA